MEEIESANLDQHMDSDEKIPELENEHPFSRPDTSLSHENDAEMRELAAKMADADIRVEVHNDEPHAKRFAAGTYIAGYVPDLTYDKTRFTGIESSRFIKEVELTFSKITSEYSRFPTDWDEYRSNKIPKSFTDSIENTLFSFDANDELLYVKWHGHTISGTLTQFSPCYDIVDVHDAVIESKLQEALDQVLETIGQMEEKSHSDWKKMQYTIAFIKELCKVRQVTSTLGWVIVAIFSFQLLLNLSVPKKHYLIPPGKKYDIMLDALNITGEKTKAYRYTVAHHVFELICTWALGFRVPAAVLRPQFIFSDEQRSFHPEIYLRHRHLLVDRDFLAVALSNVLNYIVNIQFDSFA